MSKSNSKTRDKFLAEVANVIKLAAKNNNKEPQEVTKAEYISTEGAKTDWELRTHGSFGPLKNLLFPDARSAETKAFIRNVRSYKNKIDKTAGNKLFITNELSASLEEIYKKVGVKLHKPVKTKKSKAKINRSVIGHLSDTHYGINIEAAEVGGANQFDWTIAARRTAKVVDQLANYKPQYRKDTELVLVFNGDMISGVIHDQEWLVDQLATQISGSIDILSQAVSYLAGKFAKVRVYCNSGNHGRAMHKSSKQRATAHKWDSYETVVYIAVKKLLEQKYKNVTIEIPQSPYAIFDVQGHKFFTTHGDTVINVGNPGSSINITSISNQINKINAGLAKTIKDECAVVMVGHVHTNTVQLLDNGVNLIMNGCLSGLDPFANSIGIVDSHPSQQVFEVTKDYPVGDFRMIRLNEADTDKSLDKIIKPFQKPF